MTSSSLRKFARKAKIVKIYVILESKLLSSVSIHKQMFFLPTY